MVGAHPTPSRERDSASAGEAQALPAPGWLLGPALLLQCRWLAPDAQVLALIVTLVGVMRLGGHGCCTLLLTKAAPLPAFVHGAWRAELRVADSLPLAWAGRDALRIGLKGW